VTGHNSVKVNSLSGKGISRQILTVYANIKLMFVWSDGISGNLEIQHFG
jgi:hypothetical protein